MNTIIIDGLSFALPLFIMAIGGIYCERSGIAGLRRILRRTLCSLCRTIFCRQLAGSLLSGDAVRLPRRYALLPAACHAVY